MAASTQFFPAGILTTWGNPLDIKAWVGYTFSYYPDKESIPSGYRAEGMHVWAKESGLHKLYQLQGGISNSDYVEVTSLSTLTDAIVTKNAINSNVLDVNKQLRNVPEASTRGASTWEPDLDLGMVHHVTVTGGPLMISQPQHAQEGATYVFIFSFSAADKINFAETHWPKLGMVEGEIGDVFVVKAEYYNSKMYGQIISYTTQQSVSGYYGTDSNGSITPVGIVAGTAFTDNTPEQLAIDWENTSAEYLWFWAPDTHVYNYYKTIGFVFSIDETFNVVPIEVGTTDGYLYMSKIATQISEPVFYLDDPRN